jgi:hypothetical protein
LLLSACDDEGKRGEVLDSSQDWDGEVQAVDPECSSVRLTQYWSTIWGWCEFPSDRSFLPSFAREGITLAIAEPWNTSSYGGEPGEACGECWEISTSFATQVVMVHDLCPIEGNPLCAGSQFHFDLTPEAAAVLQGGSNDAAVARRVPCPVSGSVYAAIHDWNQWGYLRLSFMNHRIPIRAAEVRAEPDGEWLSLERSGGAWQLPQGPGHDQGEGIRFRLQSAQGQVLTGERVIAYQVVTPGQQNVQTVDLGLQFDDLGEPVSGECRFVPDGDVYTDGWGGMEGVEWTPLLWDGASLEEQSSGCQAGSRCLRVELEQWSGFHLYLRQAFPTESFSTLRFWARGDTAGTTLSVSASHEGERCEEQTVTLGEEWAQVSIDLSATCAGRSLLTSVTVQNTSPAATLYLDEMTFLNP